MQCRLELSLSLRVRVQSDGSTAVGDHAGRPGAVIFFFIRSFLTLLLDSLFLSLLAFLPPSLFSPFLPSPSFSSLFQLLVFIWFSSSPSNGAASPFSLLPLLPPLPLFFPSDDGSAGGSLDRVRQKLRQLLLLQQCDLASEQVLQSVGLGFAPLLQKICACSRQSLKQTRPIAHGLGCNRSYLPTTGCYCAHGAHRVVYSGRRKELQCVARAVLVY